MTKRLGVLTLLCALAATVVFLSGCSTEEYEPPAKSATISTPVIGSEGTLRVGVNASNAPFAGQVSGKIVGVDVDIAAALADHFGLKLEILDISSDVDGALEQGTVDIVMGVDKSSTAVESWKSDVYIQSGVSLFAQSSDTMVPDSNGSPSIAAQSSSMSAWEVTNQFGEGSLVPSDDIKSAFEKVKSGEATYVAADAVIGTYAAHVADSEFHIIALMQSPSGYCIGVSDANSDLKTVISEALETLTNNGIISIIETKWLGSALNVQDLPSTSGNTNSLSDDSGDNNEGEEKTENDGLGDDNENQEGDENGEDNTNQVSLDQDIGSNAVQLT